MQFGEGTPNYIQRVSVDVGGAVDEGDLPTPLPYGLSTRAFVRTVEDVQDLLFDLNLLLHAKHYERAESLLDPAGFSGLISRTVVDRLARASRTLVINRYHNGYPDLLERGRYPGDSAQHGEGGLEVKASRYEGGWQTHGPRAGWFCVVQFQMDQRAEVATFSLEATRIVAVMVAPLEKEDWNWQPAREGKIRSGTASVKASGVAKLRAGAVWVDPLYRVTHDRLLAQARTNAFGREIDDLLLAELRRAGGAATAEELATRLASAASLPQELIMRRVTAALARLRASGRVTGTGRTGRYALS